MFVLQNRLGASHAKLFRCNVFTPPCDSPWFPVANGNARLPA